MKIIAVFTATILMNDGSAIENETFIFRFMTGKDEVESRFTFKDSDALILNTILGDYLMCNFNYDCSGYGMIPLEHGQGIEDPITTSGPFFAIAVEKIRYFKVNTIEKLIKIGEKDLLV
ncbi:MAG: hypothetical protein IJU76_05105 [Desulfovibrionaceae bacterium]|nr:hypothetical protein [Desulfovibrionaceae bacterium]